MKTLSDTALMSDYNDDAFFDFASSWQRSTELSAEFMKWRRRPLDSEWENLHDLQSLVPFIWKKPFGANYDPVAVESG